MIQVTICEAKIHLAELIEQARAGEEIIITKNDQPLVKLSVILLKRDSQRRLGGAKDAILAVGDDFDAPLTEFDNYMCNYSG